MDRRGWLKFLTFGLAGGAAGGARGGEEGRKAAQRRKLADAWKARWGDPSSDPEAARRVENTVRLLRWKREVAGYAAAVLKFDEEVRALAPAPYLGECSTDRLATKPNDFQVGRPDISLRGRVSEPGLAELVREVRTNRHDLGHVTLQAVARQVWYGRRPAAVPEVVDYPSLPYADGLRLGRVLSDRYVVDVDLLDCYSLASVLRGPLLVLDELRRQAPAPLWTAPLGVQTKENGFMLETCYWVVWAAPAEG